ncbi:hypothetical protein CHELA20_40326 [Hyphomicrobiales bacterium]|nr:hypothetical protein CHELA20_40326 [Hyphomicrobiales bacterium]
MLRCTMTMQASYQPMAEDVGLRALPAWGLFLAVPLWNVSTSVKHFDLGWLSLESQPFFFAKPQRTRASLGAGKQNSWS